jgi:subtilisin family serine protease
MKNIFILGLTALVTLSMGAFHPLAAAEAQNNSPVRVLIGFDKPVGASEQALVRAFGGKIKYSYTIVNAVAAQMPESALEGLSRNPHVSAIEADDTVYAVEVFDTELDNSWGVKHIQSGDAHAGNGVTPNKGTVVKIGIIDSGVNYYHPDLSDNFDSLNLGYDFYYYDTDPMDVYGHGTHVAGTACAEDNGNGAVDGNGNPLYGVVGVAPECALYSLRVLNENGVGYWSDIIAAVEWSTGALMQIENVFTGEMLTVQGEKMDVVNLSLGKSGDPGTIVKQSFDNAYNDGVLIVAAAGNSGNKGGKNESTIYPAKFDSVIAVGATEDSSNNRASFSSTGVDVEIVAPGVNVYSSWNDNTDYYNNPTACRNGDINDCYKYGSGTSMASPHVAGTAALVIKALRDAGVAYTNADVRAILQSTAQDLGDNGRDIQYGYGLVNALAAVQATDPSINNTPVANAGNDQTVVDTDASGSEEVVLDGSGSYDSDGSIVSYEWYDGATFLASGVSPTVTFLLGNHTVTLVVTDDGGATGSDTVQISVTEESSGGNTNCPPGRAKKGLCSL